MSVSKDMGITRFEYTNKIAIDTKVVQLCSPRWEESNELVYVHIWLQLGCISLPSRLDYERTELCLSKRRVDHGGCRWC